MEQDLEGCKLSEEAKLRRDHELIKETLVISSCDLLVLSKPTRLQEQLSVRKLLVQFLWSATKSATFNFRSLVCQARF